MRRDVVVAVLALVALLAVPLLNRHDETPQAATHGSADYSFGGYRAWYELLVREGVRVERFRRHHDALRESGIDTLVMAFPDASLPHLWGPAERDALRAWVRNGGRLVDIGLTPRADKNDARNERVYLENLHGAPGALSGPWSAWVNAVGARGTYRLAPVKGARVETLLRDRGGALVVRYRYGRGEVIGVAGASAFENRALGAADDARLAYLVARPGRPGGLVAFDETIRRDVIEKPWYQALSVPELVALALAGLAGLLWIAYGIVPLGPPVRLRAPREPTSEEFVDAVASLYQRARARVHAGAALVADARRALARAPDTAHYRALAGRLAAAETEPLRNDATLVAVAVLARTAREEIIRATSPDRGFAAAARGARARRRRR
jgi:uncharacterized protein DUF4350